MTTKITNSVLDNTSVIAGSYGTAASVPTYTVNDQGRLTSSTNTSIAISATQVTSGTLAVANGGTGASTLSGTASSLVTEIGKLLFPIGSIYTNATNSTNPGTILGFWTWVSFGAGVFRWALMQVTRCLTPQKRLAVTVDATTVSHTHTVTINAAGSSGTNANYQPYITVYMWKRTAQFVLI